MTEEKRLDVHRHSLRSCTYGSTTRAVSTVAVRPRISIRPSNKKTIHLVCPSPRDSPRANFRGPSQQEQSNANRPLRSPAVDPKTIAGTNYQSYHDPTVHHAVRCESVNDRREDWGWFAAESALESIQTYFLTS